MERERDFFRILVLIGIVTFLANPFSLNQSFGAVMPPRPDLTSVFKGPSSATQGENITAKVKAYVKNRGTAEARNFYVDIVLRETSGTDHRLGRASISSLAAGRSATLNFGTILIPSDVPPGNYHLCVIADSTDVVVEGTTNEGNNTFCQRIMISAR